MENKEKDYLSSYLERVDADKNISERTYEKLCDIFRNVIKPNYHCDLHSWGNGSFPFVFMDRIFYDDTVPNALEEVERLLEKTSEMVHSMGLTVIREAPAYKYVEEKLHRSCSGTCTHILNNFCRIHFECNEDSFLYHRART